MDDAETGIGLKIGDMQGFGPLLVDNVDVGGATFDGDEEWIGDDDTFSVLAAKAGAVPDTSVSVGEVSFVATASSFNVMLVVPDVDGSVVTCCNVVMEEAATVFLDDTKVVLESTD